MRYHYLIYCLLFSVQSFGWVQNFPKTEKIHTVKTQIKHGNSESEKFRYTLIGFYNLENLFDTIRDYRIFDQDFTPEGAYHYTSAIYKQKIAHLAWVIRNMGVDKYPDGLGILGVAEVENRQVLEDLVSSPILADRDYKIVHHDGHDRRGIDVALLYRAKYFTPYAYKSIPVLLPKRKKKKHGTYTRDILQITGLLAKGDTTHIFVLHPPSRLGGQVASEPARIFVANKVRHIIDSIRKHKPQHSFIVMGDMNDNPNNIAIQEVLQGQPYQENFPKQALFNPFFKIYSQGIGTLVYKDVWFLFDQILLSKQFLQDNAGGKFRHAYIFNPQPITESLGRNKGYPKRTFIHKTYNEGYSDHYPVYIVLRQIYHKTSNKH